MAKGGNGNGKANGAKSAPVLDNVNIAIDSGTSLSFDYTAYDADKNDKLSYSFLVNGASSLSYVASDGAAFSIDPLTGHISSSNLLTSFTGLQYVLNVQVVDKFKLIDTGILTLDIAPCTEYSIDIGTISGPPVAVDAASDAFCFTTDAGVTTDVSIDNFSSNDRIVISGFANRDTLSYSTGAGPGGENDLVISYNSLITGTVEIIVLTDVLAGPGFVFDYASAVAAIGFDFIEIAPCTEYSIDIGTIGGPPVAIDAASDIFCFTTDAGVTTDVTIDNFSSNDQIVVSGVANRDVYSFSSGAGASGADDLMITYNSISTGTIEIIVLTDVLAVPGFVFNYATAAASVGYDFMTIA